MTINEFYQKYVGLYAIIVSVICIYLYARPADVETVIQTKTKIVTNTVTKEGTTKIEYRDKFIDRTIVKVEAGVTITIHETSHDTGHTSGTTTTDTNTNTNTDTQTTTTTVLVNRPWLLEANWRIGLGVGWIPDSFGVAHSFIFKGLYLGVETNKQFNYIGAKVVVIP